MGCGITPILLFVPVLILGYSPLLYVLGALALAAMVLGIAALYCGEGGSPGRSYALVGIVLGGGAIAAYGLAIMITAALAAMVSGLQFG